MAIEIVFGTGLGDWRHSPEQTVLAHRRSIELPETSCEAFMAGLHELLAGMARDCSEFVLAPDGTPFYFLLLVKKPTLGLDLNQHVTFTAERRHALPIHRQMEPVARQITRRLADLGTPAWMAYGEPRSF